MGLLHDPKKINPRKNAILKTAEGNKFRRLLDIGVGSGETPHRINAAEKIGIDLENTLKYGDVKFRKVDVETASRGKKLPFPDDYFDIVVCEDTFEHLQGFVNGKLLEEVKRIMMPGGLLVGTIPNHFYFDIRLRYLLGNVSGHHIFRQHDSHLSPAFLNAKNLRRKFEKYFRVEKCGYEVGHLKFVRPSWFSHSIVFRCRKV